MLALSSSMSLWAAGRWSSPPGGVGGRRCTNRCITNTKHLKRRPACLASRSVLFCSHHLRTGLGAAAPETTLHCSTSKSNLLSQWASRLGQHARGDTCKGAQTGWGELPPHSCWLGPLPLAIPVIARYFFVAFQKRIMKSGAALQSEPSGPGDHPGNPPLPITTDGCGRRRDFCLLPSLPFPAGDQTSMVAHLVYCHIFGTSTVQGLSCSVALQVLSAKGPGSVVVAVGITRTAKICLIHSSASNIFPH